MFEFYELLSLSVHLHLLWLHRIHSPFLPPSLPPSYFWGEEGGGEGWKEGCMENYGYLFEGRGKMGTEKEEERREREQEQEDQPKEEQELPKQILFSLLPIFNLFQLQRVLDAVVCCGCGCDCGYCDRQFSNSSSETPYLSSFLPPFFPLPFFSSLSDTTKRKRGRFVCFISVTLLAEQKVC